MIRIAFVWVMAVMVFCNWRWIKERWSGSSWALSVEEEMGGRRKIDDIGKTRRDTKEKRERRGTGKEKGRVLLF